MKNLVVFASGSGSNFQSIIDAISEGKLQARITGLVSDKDTAYALQRASDSSIKAMVISPSQYANEEVYISELLDKLSNWNTDLIILAGYLKKIPLELINEYENRILNIHPSLLPKYGGKGFYGSKVHHAVVENKESESGCSIHIVTENYDEGPIIAQAKVPVYATDTPDDLGKRILVEEHKLYPVVINDYLKTLKKK